MPRSRLDDIMQNYAFWIFDAGVLGGNVLFPVLDPSLAFASLTAPEVSVETKQVQHGNWEYKAQVVKTAMPSSITLSRGTRFYDSDMWNWINAAIRGKDPVRRNLFMVHFMGLRESSGGVQVGVGAALGAANALASGGNAVAGAAGGAIIGNFIGNRIPGRAWVLHDCFDESTEILGKDGWVGSEDVSEGEEIYSMNLTTGLMELVEVQGYVRRPAGDDKFIEVNGRSVNFSVTGKHGFYVRRYGSEDLRRVTADELYDMSGEYQVPVSGHANFTGVDLSDDELKLVAWYITDGHMKASRLIISQSKEHRQIEIRSLLQRIGMGFTERLVPAGSYGGLPCLQFGIPKGNQTWRDLSGWDKISVYLDKDISPLLHNMTRRQFEVFWTEMVKGDGSFRNDEGVALSQLWCSRKSQADALMQMAVLRGIAISCGESVTENGHEMYCLYPRLREWMLIRPKRLRVAKSPMVQREPRPGEHVWCVSNKNRTVIARRGGKVMIIGNCVPIRYKAGSDFDATSGAVSIQELEVQPEYINEVTVSTVAPGVSGAIGAVRGAIEVVSAIA